MIRTIGAFLDFCYLVRREVHGPENLDRMKAALSKFHEYQEIFRETEQPEISFRCLVSIL